MKPSLKRSRAEPSKPLKRVRTEPSNEKSDTEKLERPTTPPASDADQTWLWSLFQYNHPYFGFQLMSHKQTPAYHYYDLFDLEEKLPGVKPSQRKELRGAKSYRMFKFAWFSWTKDEKEFECYEDEEANRKFQGTKLEELGVFVDSWLGRQYILCPVDHFDRLPEAIDALTELSPLITLTLGKLDKFPFRWHRGMPPFSRESFERVFVDSTREKVIEWSANRLMKSVMLDEITEWNQVVCPWNYSTPEGKDFCRWLRTQLGFAPEFDLEKVTDDDYALIYQYGRCNRVARALKLFHESDGWCRHHPSGWQVNDRLRLDY